MKTIYHALTLKAPRLFFAVCAAGASTVAVFASPVTATDSLWADVVSYLVIGTVAWVGIEIRNLQKDRLTRAEERGRRDIELERRLSRIENKIGITHGSD